MGVQGLGILHKARRQRARWPMPPRTPIPGARNHRSGLPLPENTPADSPGLRPFVDCFASAARLWKKKGGAPAGRPPFLFLAPAFFTRYYSERRRTRQICLSCPFFLALDKWRQNPQKNESHRHTPSAPRTETHRSSSCEENTENLPASSCEANANAKTSDLAPAKRNARKTQSQLLRSKTSEKKRKWLLRSKRKGCS